MHLAGRAAASYSRGMSLPLPEIVRRARSTVAERAAWAQRYQRSGLTVRAFAAQHRRGLSTLQRWLAQARSAPRATALQWQELKLPMVSGASGWAAELVRPDGLTLRLAHDAPPAWVVALWRLPSC